MSSLPVYITDGQGEQQHTITANGIIEGKQILTTTAGGKTHFSPIGPLHLTAEEMNEILMKRALSAAQQGHTITTTTADGQTEIHYQQQGEVVNPVHLQVQKVIQGLEEQDDSQGTSSTHCKLEPVLEISPKTEIQEIVSRLKKNHKQDFLMLSFTYSTYRLNKTKNKWNRKNKMDSK